MKSQEKIKERVAFYTAFLKEVSERINAGVVQPEELYAIAEKYELPGEMFDAMIAEGHLNAFDVSIPFFPPVAVRRLYPLTPHVLAWSTQPGDELAFTLYIAELIADQTEAFVNYQLDKVMASAGFFNCPQCHRHFNSKKSISGFCSDSCRALASDKGCRVKPQVGQKDAWDNFLEATLDLLREMIPQKNNSHEKR